MNRKTLKSKGRAVFLRHYFLCVICCLIAGFIGIDYVSSIDSVNSIIVDDENESIGGGITSFVMNNYINVSDLFSFEENSTRNNKVDEILVGENSKSYKIGGLELGRSNGVLAKVVNIFTSGSITITIINAIKSVASVNTFLAGFLVVVGLLVIFMIWMLFLNTFSVSMRRIFLECRNYEKISVQRFIFPYKVRRLLKTALTLLLWKVYQTLWMFTIVGGIIKYFSYFLVPYIVAENPDISPNTAIKLSRDMMKGHKMECFILHLSFIGWNILSAMTFGLLSIFYVSPYKESVYCEYYTIIRQESIKNKVTNIHLLNDKYLYISASHKKLESEYSDIIQLRDTPVVKPKQRNKVLNFLSNTFGVVFTYDKNERIITENAERELKISSYKDIIQGKMYPDRLLSIKAKGKEDRQLNLHYMRRYSVFSLILMFFVFCFIGWLWEVCFHLVSDGQFVNRGVLHGPWLPIYGSGCLMILILLNKLRKHPVVEFLSAVVLCGIVEYFTSFFLEYYFHEKWWDYSGYFLNIDNRVCAEGLLVFGIGGIVVVYLVAPLLDNIFRKIPNKIIIPICIILLALFTCDEIYSAFNPNKGENITDYAEVSQSVASKTSYSDIYYDKNLFSSNIYKT